MRARTNDARRLGRQPSFSEPLVSKERQGRRDAREKRKRTERKSAVFSQLKPARRTLVLLASDNDDDDRGSRANTKRQMEREATQKNRQEEKKKSASAKTLSRAQRAAGTFLEPGEKRETRHSRKIDKAEGRHVRHLDDSTTGHLYDD